MAINTQISRSGDPQTHQMSQKRHKLLRILEAPLAHIQPFNLFADQLLRVERWVPGLDEEGTKDDFDDVGADGSFGGFGGGFRGVGRDGSVRDGEVGGH